MHMHAKLMSHIGDIREDRTTYEGFFRNTKNGVQDFDFLQ